ncbi:MAG: GMC family oxidoreductase N-terminal domain-containing protein [Aestuariivita sp.]|uniref:GMC family oxidoreductase n=1 Tax=Aestuariivita sp. TaxID=1872407 RepID=UPI003BAFE8E5
MTPPTAPSEQSYDYIVVGGGSSGCVLAARLSENPAHRVLLLESGRWDTNPWIHIPATFFRVNRGVRDVVKYWGEAQPELGGRGYLLPQGQVIGGGSSVNAMLYVRGQADDYNSWAQMGCPGWSYDDVLPVFRDLEGNDTFGGDYHGQNGPLAVSNPRHRHPLSLAFLQAAQEVGLPLTEDFNGAQQEGMGFYQTTTVKGRRCSAARAFLKPALGRRNLTVLTQARVDKLIVTGRRAMGVLLTDGRRFDARAEIVLTAGALATPAILMRSGLGPAAHLTDRGVDVVADLTEVGRNFQDHVAVPVEARLKNSISVHGHDSGLKGARHMLQYLTTRRGLLASNIIEAGGFVDTAGTGRPDIQFHFMPTFSLASDGTREDGHGLGFSACVLRPQSRGEVRLRSADPVEPVRLHANVLSAQADRAAMLRGVRLALKILDAPAMRALISERTSPKQAETDADLMTHIAAAAKTVFHPVGTCRMGGDDASVVDAQLRVRRIDGLRISDASVMPSIVSGNTNAPTIMIAERCARFMRAAAMHSPAQAGTALPV